MSPSEARRLALHETLFSGPASPNRLRPATRQPRQSESPGPDAETTDGG